MKFKRIKILLVAIALFFPGKNLLAQGQQGFKEAQIQAIKTSCDSISGPGKPVIGDGHGGRRSGSDGIQYSGVYKPDPRWTPMDASKTSGSVIKDGLLPPIKPLLELNLRDTEICLGGDGNYYLGAADDYQGRYSSCVAMSDNIYDPSTRRQETVPCGGGTGFFKDKKGNWWCSYFGNDSQSPWREKPGIVKVDFTADGKIVVSKNQPFIAASQEK